MLISDHFITKLLSRIDLVDLIAKKIQLRKAGTNWVGLCPFHQEKTPSFSINQERQFFYCFGCKKSGDAIQFIVELEHKTFVDAVIYLADCYGLGLELKSADNSEDNVETTSNSLINQIYQVNQIAEDYFHQILFNNNANSNLAMAYLKKRSISLDAIKKFKLGLATAGWHNLLDFFRQKKIDQKLLLDAGLIINKDDNSYDRFRLRIMFPIKNKFNQTVGFGARSLTNEQQPKYLNSPETIVFKKNQELYGLNFVNSKFNKVDSLIIVEGYLDVITLIEAGINNVVATLGTAINETHLRIMFSVTSVVIFCFDGDGAGYQAMVKAMDLAMAMLAENTLPANKNIKFALLPKDYDPDLLIKNQGSQQFMVYINKAQELSKFFFEYLIKKYPLNTVENSRQLMQEARNYFVKFKDKLLKNLWEKQLKEILGINYKSYKDYKYFKNNNKNYKYNANNNDYPATNAARAISMLIFKPKLLEFCNLLEYDKFITTKLPEEIELLVNIINFIKTNTVDLKAELITSVYKQELKKINIDRLIQSIPEDGIEQEFIGAVKMINKELKTKLVDDLLILSKNRNLDNQEKLLLQQLLQEL